MSDKELVQGVESSALAVRTGSTTGKTKSGQTPVVSKRGGGVVETASSGQFERSLKDQLELWEEYLKAETVYYLIHSYTPLIHTPLLI